MINAFATNTKIHRKDTTIDKTSKSTLKNSECIVSLNQNLLTLCYANTKCDKISTLKIHMIGLRIATHV